MEMGSRKPVLDNKDNINNSERSPRNESNISQNVVLEKDEEGLVLEEVEEVRMHKTTGVAGKLFWAPSPWKLVLPIIGLSIFLGYIALFDFGNISANLTLDKFYTSGILFGLVILAVPALIAGLTITPLARSLGGVFYARRAMLLAFTSLLFITIILILAKIISYFTPIDFFLTAVLVTPGSFRSSSR
jgi:hypothetical protein